ncbi:MAG: ROK family transcriptional regulator [Paenirhodobacter sp.]|uniref:ROK family transcriptional regulator n=1 Tax=Paenirhodobacter sp. TaxID=1965326 RepID=UPI003D11B063
MNAKPPSIRAMSGTSSGAAAVHNRRVVIDAIRVNGALSRADLARATRLAKQTLSNIIDELQAAGLVIAREVVKEGRGKPATPYDLAPFGAFSIGVQIDRHVARCVVMNLVGEIVLRRERAILPSEPEAGLKILARLIRETRSELAHRHPEAEERTVGLGIAMPGPFSPEARQARDDYTMARWQEFPLAQILARETGLETNIQNDAAAAAIAEKLTGRAHGLRNAVCLYLGYGLGAGLILNGELYRGQRGDAGEIGMIRPLGGGDLTIERQVALGEFYARVGLDPADPQLAARIEALFTARMAEIEPWLDAAAAGLGWLADALRLALDPEAIILCSTAPARLVEQLVARVNLAPHARRRLLAGHSDPWIVAIGAAAEPISRSFEPKYAALLKP